MFDMGLEQLSDDELLAELRRRFHSMVFAGLASDGYETTYILGGQKLCCIGLAATLADHCIHAEVE